MRETRELSTAHGPSTKAGRFTGVPAAEEMSAASSVSGHKRPRLDDAAAATATREMVVEAAEPAHGSSSASSSSAASYGADLVRALADAATADGALEKLHALIVEPAIKTGGRTRKQLNSERLPFVVETGPGTLVGLLLGDIERRAAALHTAAMANAAAGVAAASTAAAGLPDHGAAAAALGLAASVLDSIAVDYNWRIIGPALRRLGFDRFHRTWLLAMRAVHAVVPTPTVHPHLVIYKLWNVAQHAACYFWPTAVDKEAVAAEWEASLAPHSAAIVEASLPILNCSDTTVLRHEYWASVPVSLTDHATLADALAVAGGMEPLLREVSDAGRMEKTRALLITTCNAARFVGAAACIVEANGPSLLKPLLYHDERSIVMQACHAISLLAGHAALLDTVKATGALTSVLNILRAKDYEPPNETVFAPEDVAAVLKLSHKDNTLPVRLCGAKILRYFATKARGNKELVAMLMRMGVVERAREFAVDADAFLYLAGAGILSQMDEGVPSYRDPAAAATSAASSGDDAVLSWGIDEVCAWVGKQPFAQYRANFRACLVEGVMLATMTDDELAAMGIANVLHRKAVRSAIGRLLSRAGLVYAHAVAPPLAVTGAGTAATEMSSAVSPLRAVHAASGSPMAFVPLPSPIGPAGAAAAAVGGAGTAGERGLAVDVFISYRRDGGSVMAHLLDSLLRIVHGFRTFLDVECLTNGDFEEALWRQLGASRNVVVVLSKGALDRCMVSSVRTRCAACVLHATAHIALMRVACLTAPAPAQTDIGNKDVVRKEIATSLQHGKNVVPVYMDDFQWPRAEDLPEDMRGILSRNSVLWSHAYRDATIGKLISFLKR